MLTVTLRVAVFPALSVAVTLKTWFIPTLFTVIGDAQFAIPDRASEQLNVMVTGVVVFTPLALGAGEREYEMIGGVLSMLTATAAVAVFPAWSVAVPGTVWLAPSVLTVTGGGQLAIGAVPAAHANPTVTAVLFHPAAFGPGVAVATIAGGLVPMLRVRVAVAEFPATSETVPVTV
jgi:hypothetical protein